MEYLGERARQWQRDRQLVGYLNQAARAIEGVQDRQNQLLHIAKLEQERTAQELRLAHEIQVSFLPEQCPALPGWEISADWYAAREVGGDFFDFIPLDEEHLGLVIADVSDKGMPAALFMSLCRTLVRASATQLHSPATVLQRVNELILAQSRSNMLLTAFYGVLNWRSGVFTYANAGHPPPILWCQACAAKPPLPTLTAKGIILGVMEGITLQERQVTLTPGDILILYTDGVTEPINLDGEEFGEERLARIIASSSDQPCSDIVRQIRSAVWDFAGQQSQFDDYTLVGIKRSCLGGAPSPALSAATPRTGR
jgi:sigma-B regulation protein RsbU (phosphoserine phosphatase)